MMNSSKDMQNKWEQSSVASESSDDGMSTESPHTQTQRSESTKEEPLTLRETVAVNRSKVLVYIAIVLAACAVGFLTYYFTSSEERADFQRSFIAFADEVVYNTNDNALNIMGQLQVLATSMASLGDSRNLPWPNVTVPHFDFRAKEAEELSGIDLIVYASLVRKGQEEAWEAYAWENQGYIEEEYEIRGWTSNPGNISKELYPYVDAEGNFVSIEDVSMHAPFWQSGPVPANASIINLDLYTNPSFKRMMDDVLEIKHEMLSEAVDLDFILKYIYSNYTDNGHPLSYILMPVFGGVTENASDVVGFLAGELTWQTFFVDVLPKGTKGILVDIYETCGSEFTYTIYGHEATFDGRGDLHDSRYDGMKRSYPFAEFARYDGAGEDASINHCDYTINIYPTVEFEESFYTSGPAIYTAVVVLVFVATACIFALYDYMVYRRQTKLLKTAQRTNQIVSSLFPSNVKQRILEEAEEQARREMEGKGSKTSRLGANTVAEFLGGQPDDSTQTAFETKPIADLFPSVTVMFADIVGFTAWSSMREPSQVFTLLETIYHEFDMIAKKRRVFKVETVGDCYVAVCGLPEPRRDHAVVMARFARDCLFRMEKALKRLEVSLGPDTTELGMRVGLHSGPVTAGVLRGERARFQLFGDTMNTTARIESTGVKNKIHVSQETADLLAQAGKHHWVKPREDKVTAKGKGELTTFFLETGSTGGSSTNSGSSQSALSETDSSAQGEIEEMEAVILSQSKGADVLSDKHLRLCDWNVDIMSRLLQEILASREAANVEPDAVADIIRAETEHQESGALVLDEVQDVMAMSPLDETARKRRKDPSGYQLGDDTKDQLRAYVRTIAAMYRKVPFHNWEHASHVTMSVTKLLARIVDSKENQELAYADRIISDPLAKFAFVFSAMIHDVDHTGVPNSQLIKEQAGIAAVYRNKSVAEQNSVDIAWDLLLQDGFEALRRAIYSTVDEFKRFRQLVVNTVMATDIMDKELSTARKARWNMAFVDVKEGYPHEELTSAKATIVAEYLIQASDVAHTMQHWHIYRKWNARLFEEMYKAYKEGRAENDPSTTWYKGEIGFFDFYIIPLARKLRECGVFGVSGDEYLNYAQQNRREWESRGEELVHEMLEKIRPQYE